MAKILECARVNPSSGCKQVIRGEITRSHAEAAEHAKEHLINSVLLDFSLLVL